MTLRAADAATAWRFKAGVVAEVLDDHLIVITETGNRIFSGAPFAVVGSLLDGARSAAEVCSLAGSRISADQLAEVIGRLARAGFIITGQKDDDEITSYIEAVGAGAADLQQRLAKLTVAVIAIRAQNAAAQIAAQLSSLRCTVRVTDTSPLPGDDFCVVVVRDYLDPELAPLNRIMVEKSLPWLLAKPFGQELWVGPRFVSPATGCWACLASRLAGNRPVERFLARHAGRAAAVRPAAGMLPGADGIVAAIVGSDLLAPAADTTPLTAVLKTVTLTDFQVRDHPLARLEQCATCGDPVLARRDPAAIAGALANAGPIRSCRDRGLTSADLMTRLGRHVDSYLGIVSELRPAERGPSRPGCTYLARHETPLNRPNVELLQRSLAMRSSGGGTRPEQAQAAALCEAMERYCGAWIDGTPVIRASWRDLDNRAVHPSQVLLFSAGQYAERESWNADPLHALHTVPMPFDETRPVDFAHAWSITRAESVLVPAGLVWYGHPDLIGHPYAVTDSNGCAAGYDVLEATLYALCEIYERDAAAIWWYNRVTRPQVDLSALSNPEVDRLLETSRLAGRATWVLDITTNLSMPAYAALSCDSRTSRKVLFGFGAHPDRGRAIGRALAEMDQLLPLAAAGDGHGGSRYTTNPAVTKWLNEVACDRESWLRPDGVVSFSPSTPDGSRDLSIGEAISRCVRELETEGIEAIFVDQSRPDVDLAVARVIVPGMRHFWRRTAPGRLFDVPVRLGWISEPRPEAELNPLNIFV